MIRAVCVAVGFGAAALAWMACDEPVSHVFVAGQYNPPQQCIFPGTAIDVLSGPPPTVDASCAPTCVVPPFDSGVYVTAMCPPYPYGDVTGSSASPLCAAAVAALSRHDLCSIDGGPPTGPGPDAGHDAGHDAGGGDAPKDASATQ
jgi:hypothetical protein